MDDTIFYHGMTMTREQYNRVKEQERIQKGTEESIRFWNTLVSIMKSGEEVINATKGKGNETKSC